MIEQYKLDLLDYTRLRRNAIAHDLPASTYFDAFNKVAKHKADFLKIYPNQKAILSSYDNFGFDDFILCTANLKNISDMLTVAIGRKLDWKKIGKSKPSYINYGKIKGYGPLENERKITHIQNTIQTIYGIKLSEKECKYFL